MTRFGRSECNGGDSPPMTSGGRYNTSHLGVVALLEFLRSLVTEFYPPLLEGLSTKTTLSFAGSAIQIIYDLFSSSRVLSIEDADS